VIFQGRLTLDSQAGMMKDRDLDRGDAVLIRSRGARHHTQLAQSAAGGGRGQVVDRLLAAQMTV